ncbi:hypothetical protein EH243_00370 [Amphritea opalescens]|uniref:Uncharacterized protein n=1 Tax=Amphritea opalescens TaxID=2490544 RepID=A0A430KVC1_9GAMM|nr:hypothetical protein [Amphritea opalescens]RTE67442.1 hypothetical protein EH243_00370 [Amphritea opalescens]
MVIFNKKIALGIVPFVCLMLAGCDRSVTATAVSNRSVQLDSDHVLMVEKMDQNEVEKGVITGHVYKVSDVFKYAIELKPEQAIWSKRGAEPKHLLLCDEGLYLHFMEKRRNPLYVQPEPEAKAASEALKYIVGHHYSQFVDKRYLFNWLGDAYWVDISQDQYASAAAQCEEYPIPNDNEFIMTTDDKG